MTLLPPIYPHHTLPIHERVFDAADTIIDLPYATIRMMTHTHRGVDTINMRRTKGLISGILFIGVEIPYSILSLPLFHLSHRMRRLAQGLLEQSR